jgi:predicted nucleotidyltransferase
MRANTDDLVDMIEVTEKVLAEMTETIVREIDPEQIYLFGSRARGEARANSDVDLLIVEGEPFGLHRSRRVEMSRIRRAVARFRIPVDILVYSADEVAQWRHSINHVIARCLREGKRLYARS